MRPHPPRETRSTAGKPIGAALLGAALLLAGCSGGGGSSGGTPPPTGFTLGGSISGLGSNSGLVLANGTTTLTVSAGATTFSFPTQLPSGTTYAVTVQSSPAGLTCSVAGGTGTLSANVSNVVVTCADNAYTVGGTIALAAGSSGASISGLVLANGSDVLNVPAGATTFTMPAPVAYQSSYQVVVKTQPTGMSCAVSPSTPSTMPASNVITVKVTCSDQPYALGGTVTINGPSGVSLSDQGLVIDNTSNGDSYTFNANASTFTMPMGVPYGSAYALTVASQPTGLVCAINNPNGTMPAGNVSVAVTCSDQSYTVGGTVTINVPTGVTASDQGMVLTNTGNGDTDTFLTNSTSFTMPQSVPYGSAYAITVTAQPTGLVCTVSNPSTTMPASNVTNVVVTCSDQTYTLGGTITGLGSNSGLQLTNEGTDLTTILANATTFTMNSPVPSGAPYDVAVVRVPTALSCAVANGTGTMPASNVSNVSVACAAGSVSVLASLGATGDGSKPYGNLIQATDGNLYGMAEFGGTNGTGAVIKVTPSGAESVLYSFAAAGAGDGANPKGSLIQASDGNFYGLTPNGGANGTGAVIKVTPSGAESVLYSFAATGDGANPDGSLVQASDGTLYGMTTKGGANGAGTVFAITLAGVETVIHPFGATGDGALPYGALIEANDGNLYGMTANGGANGTGAVIKVTLPADTESVLYSFAATGDGATPYGALVQANDGNLYGLTQSGGTNNAGIAFKLTLAGAETKLHSFGGTGDGLYPFGNLIQASDGNLYGLAQLGGAHNFGILFRMTLTGTETVLHGFGASGDGSEPYGSLLQASNGGLYGMTVLGGTNSLGTIFELN